MLLHAHEALGPPVPIDFARVRANVDVHNLLDLVVASELPDAMGDFDDLLFYPQPGAVKYVRSNRKRGNMNSRLHASIN